MKKLTLIAAFALLLLGNLTAQMSNLREKINEIIGKKRVEVGVSLVDTEGVDTFSLNGSGHFPMQSVFKFHIAIVMLSEIDKGRFSLRQKVKITPQDLTPDLYSPIRTAHPEGVTLSIAAILDSTVSKSDNVGCDVLLRLLGGPEVVEAYFLKNNFDNIAVKINEKVMQSNWDLQFQNWTTPVAATRVLSEFYFNKRKLLSKKSHKFLWRIMTKTQTGLKRLKGQLPTGTVVAHKTGWSGTNKAGITAATNDIGAVILPNGKPFFISVFVTNSQEDMATNEKIIADIAKAAWDYFTQPR